MTLPEIETMMRNIEFMRSEMLSLWNAIFALPEEERQDLRVRYTQAYQAYREYLAFVKERAAAQRGLSRSSD